MPEHDQQTTPVLTLPSGFSNLILRLSGRKDSFASLYDPFSITGGDMPAIENLRGQVHDSSVSAFETLGTEGIQADMMSEQLYPCGATEVFKWLAGPAGKPRWLLSSSRA